MLTGSELCSEVVCEYTTETRAHVPIDAVLLMEGGPLANSEGLLTHSVVEFGGLKKPEAERADSPFLSTRPAVRVHTQTNQAH